MILGSAAPVCLAPSCFLLLQVKRCLLFGCIIWVPTNTAGLCGSQSSQLADDDDDDDDWFAAFTSCFASATTSCVEIMFFS